MARSFSASEARKNLYQLVGEVNNDRTVVEIKPRGGAAAILMSGAEYESLLETAHLLGSPRNAKRLLESLAQAENHDLQEHELGDMGDASSTLA